MPQGTIAKLDDTKFLVGGIASLAVTTDGQSVVDHQQDVIDPQDLEDAEVEFMTHYRETGVMHKGGPTGRVVESVVISPDKLEAMGIPAAVAKQSPVAWWIMVKADPATYARVKSGELQMFSIQGRAQRVPV